MRLFNGQPEGPDPALVTLREEGLDEHFRQSRRQALEYLKDDEVGGFWVQAVGDGRAIAPRDNPVEGATAHRIGYVAGYDDHLDDDLVDNIATALFAHHVGVTTNPFSQGLSQDAILADVTDTLTEGAQALYRYVDRAGAEGLGPADVGAQRERARTLLSSDQLTGFWVQTIRSDGISITIQGADATATGTDAESSDPGGTNARGRPDAHDRGNTTTDDGDDHDDTDHDGGRRVAARNRDVISYVLGIPEALDQPTYAKLHMQYLVQHLFVAAGTAGRQIRPYCEAAADLTKEFGWLAETPTTV